MSDAGKLNSIRITGYGKWLIVLLLLVSLISDVGGEQPRPALGGDDKGLWDYYQVIVERNIFSRNRSRIQKTKTGEVVTKQAAPSPESYFVLKGVAQEGTEFIAFFEDKRTAGIMRIKRGDSIERGKVKNLALDYIDFELNEKTTRIAIGNNLEGTIASPTLTYDNLIEWSQSVSEKPQSSAPGDANAVQSEDAEILKRLMERRKKELGR